MGDKNNSGSLFSGSLLIAIACYYFGKEMDYYWLWKIAQIYILVDIILIAIVLLVFLGLGIYGIYEWMRYR